MPCESAEFPPRLPSFPNSVWECPLRAKLCFAWQGCQRNNRPSSIASHKRDERFAPRRLRAERRRGSLGGMSPLATTDPKELRPLLRERIEHATDEELEAVRKALLALEARRLADELGREFEGDWCSGKITEESIAQAIRDHRARHPYR